MTSGIKIFHIIQLLLLIILVGCSNNSYRYSPPISNTPLEPDYSSASDRNAPTSTTIPSPTPTTMPSSTTTPTLAPDSWQLYPVLPVMNENVREIYLRGITLGNNPHSFSIIGDCLSLKENLFGDFGKDPANYNLGDYAYLQETIDWYKSSFQRQSISVGNGYNSASILNPMFANPELCLPNENPMTCEIRVNQPSVALISLGTDDFETDPQIFEKRLRTIIEYTIAMGVIPILATKADNREGDHTFNTIIVNLAYEYDVPVWNFWLAVHDLPKRGLKEDGYHLTWGPNHYDYPYILTLAFPVRNLTALQSLDSVRQMILKTYHE